MDKIFLYWDNSNIFISAQDVAAEREGWGARSRVRIHFPAMKELACRQRPIGRTLAVGSVPPELRGVWNRLEAEGIQGGLCSIVPNLSQAVSPNFLVSLVLNESWVSGLLVNKNKDK